MNRDLSTKVFPHPGRLTVFSPIEEVLNNFYSEFFNKQSVIDKVKSSSKYPKVDIFSEEENWVVKASVPGLSLEDIQVEITPENFLKLSGNSSEEYKSSENGTYYIRELRSSQFVRTFQLPDWVNKREPDEAKLKDGLLILKWKLPEDAKLAEVPEKSKIVTITN